MTDEIPLKCAWWQEDYESDTWRTSCRKYFSLDEGAPTENGFKFCCFCGKPIDELPNEEPEA